MAGATRLERSTSAVTTYKNAGTAKEPARLHELRVGLGLEICRKSVLGRSFAQAATSRIGLHALRKARRFGPGLLVPTEHTHRPERVPTAGTTVAVLERKVDHA